MKALSRLMIVTLSSLMHPDFSGALSSAIEGGASFIQLREKEMARETLFNLSLMAKTLCESRGAQLLINGSWEIARDTGAGLHLPEAGSVAETRRALGREYFIGQSVHSLETALYAQSEGADYIVFGSVFPTASHIGSTPVGITALREVTREISIPVFAIGGVSIENCLRCLEAGAYGVAVMRAVWQTPDVAQAVAQFTAKLNN